MRVTSNYFFLFFFLSDHLFYDVFIRRDSDYPIKIEISNFYSNLGGVVGDHLINFYDRKQIFSVKSHVSYVPEFKRFI